MAGVPKDGILAASLGASLGYLFSGVDGATPLRYIASVVAASVISFALRQVKKETLSQALSCVTAASCCLVTGLALGMSEGLTAALAALYGAESLLAGGAAYFFYRSFFSPQPVRLPARACSPGNRLHRIFLCDPVICACGL